MPLELKIKDRIAKIQVLSHDQRSYRVLIDGKEYSLDVLQVEKAVYSVLYKGKSINLEMVEGSSPNYYEVNTRRDHFQVEVIDPVTRYKSSAVSQSKDNDLIIEVPMPGRIVRVLVKEGDQIQEGETAVIVSAMKMESEYKAAVTGVVKNVFVKEGDTVDGGMILIELSPLKE